MIRIVVQGLDLRIWRLARKNPIRMLSDENI